MIFSKLSALKQQKATIEIEIAKLRLLEQQVSFAPHLNVPVRVYRDGSRWVCIFESHPDHLRCVVAYGDSPAQACRNFDALWNGGYIMQDPEEEEEF